MKNLFVLFLLLINLFAHAQKGKTYDYKPAFKSDHVDVYFDSIPISDPYQWMENADDPKLEVWKMEQNLLKNKLDKKQTNQRDLTMQLYSMGKDTRRIAIEDEQEEDDDQVGTYIFSRKSKQYDRTPDLRYKKVGEGNFKFLAKAADYAIDEKDNVTFSGFQLNESKSIVSVVIGHSGSDWKEIHFFNLLTGEKLAESLQYLIHNVIWDGDGVYYVAFDKPAKGQEHLAVKTGQAVYYHQIGTHVLGDKMLYQNPDTSGKNWISLSELKDTDQLFLEHFILSRGNFYSALATVKKDQGLSFPVKNFLVFQPKTKVKFNPYLIKNDTAYIHTDWDAPNGRILTANLTQSNAVAELIPEYDMVLDDVTLLGDETWACEYRKDGATTMLFFNKAGEVLRSMDFPAGKDVSIYERNDSTATYADLYVKSFYHPALHYKLSLPDLEVTADEALYVPYDHSSFETRYVMYPSKDGTLIPMYITCRKDVKLNGKQPVLIYTYGGYGSTRKPEYNFCHMLFMLHGGILAVPNVRGGGALGSTWAEEGRGLKKQNAIDDLNAAAEYLISEKYTNPEKICLKGGSHGGFLVATAAVQRPDLYKAVVASAGVYDMMRGGNFTAGGHLLNLTEFGSKESYEGLKHLYSISPLHLIKEGVQYPDFLLITGENDDRVPPLHTYKFLAALQEKADPHGLYHMYLISGAGHGMALTREEWQNYILYREHFILDELDIDFAASDLNGTTFRR